jgi:hypothetical protein
VSNTRKARLVQYYCGLCDREWSAREYWDADGEQWMPCSEQVCVRCDCEAELAAGYDAFDPDDLGDG